jgi:hypothetical protein
MFTAPCSHVEQQFLQVQETFIDSVARTHVDYFSAKAWFSMKQLIDP